MEQLWNDMRTTVYETMGIEQTAVPVNPEEDEADSKVQSLSQELDVDALNEDFKKFAGMDDMLSRVEYDTFIKTRKIPPAIAGVLWSLLDTDGSGEVSKDEFKSALIALQSSRSWSRYCPACEYRNDCAFCQECNSGCPRCSDVSFCASCWNDHPGRQLTMEEQALHPLRLLHPLHPLLPLHICICIYIYIHIYICIYASCRSYRRPTVKSDNGVSVCRAAFGICVCGCASNCVGRDRGRHLLCTLRVGKPTVFTPHLLLSDGVIQETANTDS